MWVHASAARGATLHGALMGAHFPVAVLRDAGREPEARGAALEGGAVESSARATAVRCAGTIRCQRITGRRSLYKYKEYL